MDRVLLSTLSHSCVVQPLGNAVKCRGKEVMQTEGQQHAQSALGSCEWIVPYRMQRLRLLCCKRSLQYSKRVMDEEEEGSSCKSFNQSINTYVYFMS